MAAGAIAQGRDGEQRQHDRWNARGKVGIMVLSFRFEAEN